MKGGQKPDRTLRGAEPTAVGDELAGGQGSPEQGKEARVVAQLVKLSKLGEACGLSWVQSTDL